MFNENVFGVFNKIYFMDFISVPIEFRKIEIVRVFQVGEITISKFVIEVWLILSYEELKIKENQFFIMNNSILMRKISIFERKNCQKEEI